MKVLKFGGTSVGSAPQMQRVAEIVTKAAGIERVAVVVSAMSGVTDALLEAARRAARGDLDDREFVGGLAERHLDALAALVPKGERPRADACVRGRLDQLVEHLAGVASLGECSAPVRDAIVAAGERLIAPLLAAKLRARGLDAVVVDGTELISTDAAFGEAAVDLRRTARRVANRLAALPPSAVAVVTGFIGADAAGRTTTLGRGGSDYTASLVGAALRASAIEIWTDVDGVLTAPPRLLPGARTVPALSYKEAAALARFGAKVLHPKTMAPAARCGVALVVRNTFRPDGPRTVITSAASSRPGTPKAVAALEDLSGLPQELRPRLARIDDRLGILAVVGEGVGGNGWVARRIRAVLAAGGHRVFRVARGGSGIAVVAILPADEVRAAVARLHAGLELPHRDAAAAAAVTTVPLSVQREPDSLERGSP
ncbi:MAG: aspartate kinase [Thermoanaerobaculales bacterium]